MIKVSEEFKSYEKELKKVGFSLYDLDLIGDRYNVTMKEKRFEKRGRKTYGKYPVEEKEESITARDFACYMSSIGFFGDRVEKSYTKLGYIPTKLTSFSPDKEVKVVREFKYN